MFGLSKKPKLEIDHTFKDGGRFTSDSKGERRYYPLYGGVNTSETCMTSEYLEWTDNHYESALVSMTIPEPYRVNHAHLFGGPATFRMLYSEMQQAKVSEFFDQLEARIEQEKESVAATRANNIMIERRKAVIDQHIDVMIDGKPATISYEDLTLGAVSCPVCNNQVTTPGGEFDRISEALENTIGIESYSCETLTHCKGCNELYKVEINIRGGIV